jgi:hypothetical protein
MTACAKWRTPLPSDRQLAATFTEAMLQWDRQKAAGVPLAERVTMLSKILRLAWPFTREWKYLCAACSDTGLELHECPGDARCDSRWKERPHPAHSYGTPCWCALGNRFRLRSRHEEDPIEQAAKVRKPTRVGR